MLKLISSIIIVTTSFSVNATTYTLPPMETCTLCNPPSLTLQQTKECVVINNKIIHELIKTWMIREGKMHFFDI